MGILALGMLVSVEVRVDAIIELGSAVFLVDLILFLRIIELRLFSLALSFFDSFVEARCSEL